MNKQQHTLHDQLTAGNTSAFRRYQNMVLGQPGMLSFIKYEMITALCGSCPGAFGFLLRKLFYTSLLGSAGRNVLFGRNTTIRHGHKIRIGRDTIIDEYVVLDAKGASNKGISIQDDCIVSRNAVLSCKDGNIDIGKGSTLGMNCLIHSIKGSDVLIGDKTVIAAFTYIIGGGTYHTSDIHAPIKDQGCYSKGGIRIEGNVWIGSHVSILDGVTIGQGSIIGAGSVVNKDIPAFSIAAGVPVRIIKNRKDTCPEHAECGKKPLFDQ